MDIEKAPKRIRGWRGISVLVAGLGLMTSIVVFAAIPGANGVIEGCYNKTNGNLRVVSSPTECRNGEASINWNQTGPQGEVGPSGGASQAYFERRDINVGLQMFTYTTLVDMPLPAGNYIVTANVAGDMPPGPADQGIFCKLTGNEEDNDFSFGGGQHRLALMTRQSLVADGNVQVACTAAGPASIKKVVVSAIKVGAIN